MRFSSHLYTSHWGAFSNAEKLHVVLKEDGSIRALLSMTRSGNTEVIAQVARGLANFAKCESRRIMKGIINHIVYFIMVYSHLNNFTSGHWRGRSLLMEDGGLSWLVANLKTASVSTRRHLELAICHLAQNGKGSIFLTWLECNIWAKMRTRRARKQCNFAPWFLQRTTRGIS